jgi:AbrB family looped-hinge helix DNA binding protein
LYDKFIFTYIFGSCNFTQDENEGTMETTATSKGQIVIPASIRKQFGIKEGTRIRVEVDDETGKILLLPITSEYVFSLHGRLKGKGLLAELKAEKNREKER